MNQQKIVKYLTLGIAIFAAYKFAQKIFPGLHQVVNDTVRTGQVPPVMTNAAQRFTGPRANVIDVTPTKVSTQ